MYGDRLVSPKDLDTYLKISKDVGKKYFNPQPSTLNPQPSTSYPDPGP